MKGDLVAAETPSASNLDNYIVSVQNTRQMGHISTRKPEHQTTEHLNTLERCQRTGKIEMTLMYCTQCLIDMPLRARHCRLCQKCVSTYDHHCPWIGNCVGERNRKYFYAFLWLQQIQLTMAMILCIKSMNSESIAEQKYGLVAIIIDILFQLFVLYLVLFHTYLASTNTTTWECLSWDKISYLKLWPRKFGSPFNIGFKKNLKLYFCFDLSGDNYFVWRLPKRRPDIKIK